VHTETKDPAFFWKRLECITEAILQPISTIADAVRNTEDYYELLKQAASFEAQQKGHRDDILLSTGKAIAPLWAAYCVRDVHRTRTFIRGVVHAVRAAQKQFPNQNLQLLYVGPGPFATLVLPLITLFGPEEIQFTLLEINPESIALLKNTIRAFEMEPYIADIEQTDAATYQVKQPVHVLLLETMQTALRQEPQVAITLNLAPQITEGGFLLPEAITIRPGLINGPKHLEYIMAHEPGPRDYYYTAEPIMQLDLEFARFCATVDHVIFPLHRTIFSKTQLQAFKQPALFTEIKVFGTETLAYWDSQLSEPYLLMQPYPDEADAILCTQYEISSTPGFRYHWE
jgi:hypothetical protein